VAFSAVFQFVPGDPGGMSRFLLEHYVEHMQFYDSLLGRTPSVVTVNYPIQRMEDPEEWLASHQLMSQSVWTGLGGGQSTDFGRLDWKNPNQVQDWFNLHRQWHASVRDSLGL
jgi:hypothetical protein